MVPKISRSLRLCGAILLLITFYSIPAFAQPDIEAILKKNRCIECHLFDSQQTIAYDQKRAPDLFFAGEKFQEKWLLKFLIDPEIIRPGGYITDSGYLKGKPESKSHIRLSRQDAIPVSQYLLTLKSTLLESVNINNTLEKSKSFRAKQLFDRQYGCASCHKTQNLMGLVKGGVSGPSLSNAGDRLQGEWIFNMLKNPALFEKKGRMPIYKIPDNDILLITKYLLSQLKENERK